MSTWFHMERSSSHLPRIAFERLERVHFSQSERAMKNISSRLTGLGRQIYGLIKFTEIPPSSSWDLA